MSVTPVTHRVPRGECASVKTSLRGLESYSFASVRVLFLLIHSLVLPGRTSSCWERAIQPPFEVEHV